MGLVYVDLVYVDLGYVDLVYVDLGYVDLLMQKRDFSKTRNIKIS